MSEAAVAIVLRPRETLELLLIKRAEHETDPWSGHMALPGGRRDPADGDLLDTAIRETCEETGLCLDSRCRMGALDEVTPGTRRLPPLVIAPFVMAARPEATAHADPSEVEAAIWVPLPALADEAAAGELILQLEGGPRSFPTYNYGEYVIWGLTHRILRQFLELAEDAGLTRS
ncbi:MAG TPA: CoA pyrophosphatase [Longimicrobiales bacterium]|nr:CoA pyrophosphatase [Longimicrobiales bacterium]